VRRSVFEQHRALSGFRALSGLAVLVALTDGRARTDGRACCACCAGADAGTGMASVGADADHLHEASSSSDAMAGRCISVSVYTRPGAPKRILPAGFLATVWSATQRSVALTAILLNDLNQKWSCAMPAEISVHCH